MPQPVDPILIAQGLIDRLNGDDSLLRNAALKITQEHFQWVDMMEFRANRSVGTVHSNLARSSACGTSFLTKQRLEELVAEEMKSVERLCGAVGSETKEEILRRYESGYRKGLQTRYPVSE